MKLEGKAAFITGGGRGLGKASALAMAREGAMVTVISRTRKDLDQVVKEIEKEGKGQGLAIPCDVSDPEALKIAIARSVEKFGRLDILMNNAAVIGPVSPTADIEYSDWQNTIDINLTAVHNASRLAVHHMAKHGGGSIINVTSGLAHIVMPPLGCYSVTKAGVLHLTRIMAAELKEKDIRVNGLDPGVMDASMQDEIRGMGEEKLGKEVYEQFKGMKDEGYLDPPEKSAELALWLASDASAKVTGENGTTDHYHKLGF